MTLDFTARKAAALWARDVSLEAAETPDHAARVAIARALLESMSSSGEGAMAQVVAILRVFLPAPDVGVEVEQIQPALEQALTICAKLGAFAG